LVIVGAPSLKRKVPKPFFPQLGVVEESFFWKVIFTHGGETWFKPPFFWGKILTGLKKGNGG